MKNNTILNTNKLSCLQKLSQCIHYEIEIVLCRDQDYKEFCQEVRIIHKEFLIDYRHGLTIMND